MIQSVLLASWDRTGRNKTRRNLGNRLDVYDKTGKRLARLGDIRAGEKPGQSSRRTASPSIRAAIFTSAKYRGRSWDNI